MLGDVATEVRKGDFLTIKLFFKMSVTTINEVMEYHDTTVAPFVKHAPITIMGSPTSTDEKAPKIINIGQEVKFFIAQLTANGDWQSFIALMQPQTAISIWWICRSILILGAFTWIIGVSLWFVPIALVFTARCLRSWGNQCHDVCHNNVFRKSRWNETLGRYFLMPLMWYEYKTYCSDHNHHHAGLGSPDQDPDIIDFDTRISKLDSDWVAFFKVISPMLFDWEVWNSSAFGQLFTMSFMARIRVVFWWIVLLTAITAVFSYDVSLNFMFLWLVSRMTTYHFVKVFAELCDHAFLQPQSVVKYTRTMPKMWLSFFLHPENDNFHIAHHLFPKIPMPNLPKVHKMLLKVDAYRQGQHLSTYFWGKRSVLKGLIGRL